MLFLYAESDYGQQVTSNLMYHFKYPGRSALSPAHPDHPGLAHYMIFGYIAPKAAVLRFVAVISHHPEIVHFKCVAGCMCSV